MSTLPNTAESVLARVAPTPSGCHEWQGYRNPKGYGQVHWNRGLQLTHRVAYEIANGPIPAGLCVLHHCDNPPCMNPEHLFLGTKADNNADAKAKGRMRGPGLRGERHGMALLTAPQVLDIRSRVATGERQSRLAREFGVSKHAINRIVKRRNWRHI